MSLTRRSDPHLKESRVGSLSETLLSRDIKESVERTQRCWTKWIALPSHS